MDDERLTPVAACDVHWGSTLDIGCVWLDLWICLRTCAAVLAVYMAPEIFDRDYHWEADMWSLGIMLYQLYARRFPYWRTYEECR